jgi:hypothetical protein
LPFKSLEREHIWNTIVMQRVDCIVQIPVVLLENGQLDPQDFGLSHLRGGVHA